MSLSAGTRLGSYEILALLGTGGMGEVYRAHDTKLGRDVALKVLPEAFAHDGERMARFAREAHVLASLNHPNIATIYGFEAGALAMELVEGPTLAERIGGRAMPLDEALPIAKQIAEGLEYAHERGVVHRDLKPANVKLTADGNVKILDFGLAKALETPTPQANPSISPTLTLEGTRAGVILGTAAYMAPEQARGAIVDKRADIWAFGVVLYEVLTGERAFRGETTTDVLAAVIKEHPKFDALPVQVRPIVEHCLRKDPRRRWQAIGDVRVALEESESPPRQQAPKRLLPWTIAAVCVLAAGFAIGLRRVPPPVPQALMRLDLELGPDAALGNSTGPSAILSPDATRLVFLSRGPDGRRRLSTRLLDQARATQLPGTEDAEGPFYSPDGQWVGFFAGGKLKKVSVQGGASITLGDASDGRGATWGEDGFIIAALTLNVGLARVSAAGGMPKRVTELNKKNGEIRHRWPQILPGGSAFLFTAGSVLGNYEDATIEVQSLKTGLRKTLLRGAYFGRYLPSGHLIYLHQGTLFAAPMDAGKLELTGPAAPLIEDVASSPNIGFADLDFSRSGNLIYLNGKSTGAMRSVSWLERSGKTQPLPIVPAVYSNPRISPDGRRMVIGISSESSTNLWLYAFERDRMSRLTFSPGVSEWPVWTPNSAHIAYASGSESLRNIYWVRSDGSGEARRLTESPNYQQPYSFSPDGKRLAYAERSPDTGFDIWTLPIDISEPDHPKPGKPELFLRTPFNEQHPALSPDGRWLAYASDETGTPEIYVRPFPGPGGQWQISAAGRGVFPIWSRNGRELFYQTPDLRTMVADYTAKGDVFVAEKPKLWSQKQLSAVAIQDYDLAPDGKRFAVLMAPGETSDQTPPTRITFLLNFFDELRRRAPAGGK